MELEGLGKASGEEKGGHLVKVTVWSLTQGNGIGKTMGHTPVGTSCRHTKSGGYRRWSHRRIFGRRKKVPIRVIWGEIWTWHCVNEGRDRKTSGKLWPAFVRRMRFRGLDTYKWNTNGGPDERVRQVFLLSAYLLYVLRDHGKLGWKPCRKASFRWIHRAGRIHSSDEGGGESPVAWRVGNSPVSLPLLNCIMFSHPKFSSPSTSIHSPVFRALIQSLIGLRFLEVMSWWLASHFLCYF